MKLLRKWMLKTHRLLGAVLGVPLLVWFLSGFVMMYRGYPNWSREEAVSLSPDFPAEAYRNEGLDSIYAAIKAAVGEIDKPYHLSLRYEPAYGVHYEVRSLGDLLRYDMAGKLLPEVEPTLTIFQEVAALWQDRVIRVDTIADLDQWTPFDRLRADLPFYRLCLAQEGRQVYLSSRDARILTEHTQSERLWSWLGAIPHWVYFTQLRQNRGLWTWVVIVLSGVGTLMLMGGVCIGIDVYNRTRRSKRGIHSPYTKSHYRWHHIFGTLGGVFMLIWCFSGLMSVVEVSSSLNHKQTGRIQSYFHSKTMQPQIDMRQVIKQGCKELSWTSVGSIPILRAAYMTDEALVQYAYWREYEGEALPLELTEEDVHSELEQALPQGEEYTLTYLSQYDDYYLSMKGTLSLPVYRAIPLDTTLPYIYIDPKSGSVQVLSSSERMRMWLYNKPHSLRFASLVQYPVLRKVIMWLLLLVGTAVSATGLLLGVHYFRRKLSSRNKR